MKTYPESKAELKYFTNLYKKKKIKDHIKLSYDDLLCCERCIKGEHIVCCCVKCLHVRHL